MDSRSGIEPAHVGRVARDDDVVVLQRADDDVCVGDVGRSTRCEQQTDLRGTGSFERLDPSLRLPDQRLAALSPAFANASRLLNLPSRHRPAHKSWARDPDAAAFAYIFRAHA